MKKFILAFMVCLGLSSGIAIAANVTPTNLATLSTEQTLPEESYESNYFREEIMPFIVANISAIGTAALGILLTLGKIKQATNALTQSNNENSKIKIRNMQLENEIAELKKDINYCKEELSRIYITSDKTKEMVKIGFCNTNELVANGYAEKIAEVANEVKDEAKNQQ